MDVSTVASELVGRLEGDLTNRSQELAGRLSQSRGQVEERLEKIRARWGVLQGAHAGLLAEIEMHDGAAEEWAKNVAASLEETQRSLQDAMKRGEAVFESSKEAILSLETRVGELLPEADATFAAVKETVETLGSELTSLDEALEQTRSLADGQLQDKLSSLVDDVTTAGEERAGRLASYVEDQFMPQVTEHLKGLKESIDAAISTGTERFENVKQQAEQGAKTSLENFKGPLGEEISRLSETAESLRGTMERIGSVVEDAGQAAGTATQLMGQSVDSVSIGAKAAVGILEDLIDIFESVT